jgi:hypothetical protein
MFLFQALVFDLKHEVFDYEHIRIENFETFPRNMAQCSIPPQTLTYFLKSFAPIM